MANDNTGAAWYFHDGTKHPDGQLLDPGHTYIDSMRPHLFKEYVDLQPEPLPLDRQIDNIPALEAIAVNAPISVPDRTVDLQALARIFHYSAGITKYLVVPGTGKRIPFRAAACTGALFHIEFYLVCGDIPGLNAGVYHLDPRGPAIRLLRQGDYRSVLIEASGNEPAVRKAPAILVLTDITARNAIKYQARAYRHAFWDAGTILANTLAIAAACQLPARIVAGFADAQVDVLLDVDTAYEFSLALVPIGEGSSIDSSGSRELGALNLETNPFTDFRIDYTAIRTMHAASSLPDGSAAARWRSQSLRAEPSAASPAALIPLEPLTGDERPDDPVELVIERRGSTRRFSHDSITFAQLSTVLHQSQLGVPADYINPPGSTLNEVYLTVHAVDGLAPGAYVLRREEWALELLESGDFRRRSWQLALGQDLAGDAAVNIFFMADLEQVLERFGNRGYRAAQLEASIAAGRMYLAAYAQRFGATGLTFYDDLVTDLFSPDAAGKSVMFMIALGHKASRSR